MEGVWFVYIVRCSDDTLYTGITQNVTRRVHEHNTSNTKSARYIRARRPVLLVYTEIQPTRKNAFQREAAIKKFSRKRKLQLIEASK